MSIINNIKNSIVYMFYRKKFVIVHMKNIQTDFEDVFFVRPELTGLTKINKSYYNLDEQYALMKWKGRNHYLVEQGDVIPKTIIKRQPKDLMINAEAVKAALKSRGYEAIFGSKTNVALIIAIIALIITLAVAVYATKTIAEVKPLIDIIYQRVQPGNITVT